MGAAHESICVVILPLASTTLQLAQIICATTASERATECWVRVPTEQSSTALIKSTATGSSTLNGGGWLLLFQRALKMIGIPLETSPKTIERSYDWSIDKAFAGVEPA
eukprot:6175195-Pleurochrysis_carterae.AAC.2